MLGSANTVGRGERGPSLSYKQKMSLHSLVLIRPALDAVWSLISLICPRLFPHRTLVGCRAMPYQPRFIADCAVSPFQTPVSLAPSLSVHLSPIVVVHAADPAMAAGVHVPRRLRSSPTEPRAPTTPKGGIDRPDLPLPYVAYVYVSSVSGVSDVCCNCFILMLQK